MKLKAISQTKLVFFSTLFFTIFFNYTFFQKTLHVYPLSFKNILFLISLTAVFISFMNLLFNLIRTKYSIKPMFIILFLLTSVAAYVMDSYGTVLDDTMFLNIFSTDTHEAFDLFSVTLLLYVVFLGVIPSFLISKIQINFLPFKNELINRGKALLISLGVIILILLSFGKNYASFFREQKTLRYYTNPTYYIYSIGEYVSHFFIDTNKVVTPIGVNAKVVGLNKQRKLVVFVVGETARRDRFSLNGYAKETNPLLKKEKVVSFNNMTSCGTSTAISVPCVFSNYKRNGFSSKKAASTENLLDVLNHTKKINILWRDNNSNSKGVALRVPYEDFKYAPTNTICTPECRDVGMLVNLQDYINKTTNGDIFIVLHQMGNHGPAYNKRYPPEFEKFKPVCESNELEKCTKEEIGNAYDNSTLYTDYFLSKVVSLLKDNSKDFGTTMFYVSDHGESLGENGIYLHGLPYFMAPDEQKNIAAVLWFGGETASLVNYNRLKEKASMPYSHDNIFHTFLGLMNVATPEYDKSLDILNDVFTNKK